MSRPIVARHYEITDAARVPDARNAFSQGWADQGRIARMHRINVVYRAFEPLLAFAGVLGLFWLAIKTAPVLWDALYVILVAVEGAIK